MADTTTVATSTSMFADKNVMVGMTMFLGSAVPALSIGWIASKAMEKQKMDMERKMSEQMKKMDAQTGEILAAAKADAEKAKQEILDSASKEAKQIMERGERQLKEERERVFSEAQNALTQMII